MALAIRTTPKGVTEETCYETKFLDSETVYKYHTIFIDKLDEEYLLNMKHNPLAISALAAVKIAKAGKSEAKRFEQAKEMIRLLKMYGFPLDVRMKVGFFIEGVVNLSLENFLKDFDEEFDVLCEERDEGMYIPPIAKRVLARKAREWVRDEGKLEGKLEGAYEKAIDVARSMLADAMSVDLVSKFTGLSVEELNRLYTR
ncbi:hypothetical protein AGMMS49957_15130 [Synergistales bacterium]|nr:hypothetical protein AGMMS49957_15130 [Synergistales bacterium]